MQKQLKDIAQVKFGFYTKSQEKGFAVYLQAKNFDDSGNLLNNIDTYMDIDSKNENHLLVDGDVLFVGKGYRNFACTYRKSMGPAVASSIFYVIRIKDKSVLSEYISMLFNSQKYQSQFQSMGAGSSILSIRKAELESLLISIPSLEIQENVSMLNALHVEEVRLSNQIIDQKRILFQGIINQIVK